MNDNSSVGHAIPCPGTTKKLYQKANVGPSDGSFQKEEQEPRCLDSNTLDTPTSHSSKRSHNHVKSHFREATSPPSSCSPKNTVIELQLREDLKYAVHEGIDENTTVDEKTQAIKSSSLAPVTQSKIAARVTACNSQSCREENSSFSATSYSSSTSRALWRSCDGCSHSSADAPHTQKVRRTPESCEKGHPGYTLLLGKEANPSIASTKHGVWRIASVARQEGPPLLHTRNFRWVSEGRDPGQKLYQRPPKPYFWRASPPRQRAPLERGQAYFIPSMSPGAWVDEFYPCSKKDCAFWDNVRQKKPDFLFVIAIFLLLTISWFLRGKEHVGSEKALLCLTDDWREYAVYLDFHRNLSVDPCNDFYTHVGSSWHPTYGYGQNASTTMTENTIMWIRFFPEFLDKGARTSPVAKKTQALFEACVAVRSTDLSNIKRFRGFLSGLNLPWPVWPFVVPSALSVLIDFALNWHDAFWLTLREAVFFFMLCHFMCHVAKLVQDPVTECNVLLRNSPHFSEAFHFVRGSPMNPEIRCGFFE